MEGEMISILSDCKDADGNAFKPPSVRSYNMHVGNQMANSYLINP